jgi:hypothetical protein
MASKISYKITGSGWAIFSIENKTTGYDFYVSYLSNPIQELFIALTNLILKKENIVSVCFADEPGENILSLGRIEEDKINICVYYKEEHDLSDMNTQIIQYQDIDTISHFSKKVMCEIDALLEVITKEEYLQQWGYPFPENEYLTFKNLVLERFWNR